MDHIELRSFLPKLKEIFTGFVFVVVLNMAQNKWEKNESEEQNLEQKRKGMRDLECCLFGFHANLHSL